MRISKEQDICPECGDDNLSSSRAHSFESILRLLSPYSPFRCSSCNARFWNSTGWRSYFSNLFYLLIFFVLLFLLFSQKMLDDSSHVVQQERNSLQSSTVEISISSIISEASKLDQTSNSSTKHLNESVNKVNVSLNDDVFNLVNQSTLKNVNDSEFNIEQERESVLKQVENWRSSWENQDVMRYLASYSVSFEPEKNLAYAVWQKQRRTTLLKPSWIKLDIDGLAINFSEDNRQVSVRFLQDYSASNYSEKSQKELILELKEDNWNIIRERSL